MNKIIQISFHDNDLYGIDNEGNLYQWTRAPYNHQTNKFKYEDQGWKLLKDNLKELCTSTK